MAQTNPGFEVIEGDLAEPRPVGPMPPPAQDHRMAIAMLHVALKALSERALTAVTDLFTLVTVGGAFYLWMTTPTPNDRQIVSLTIYALFTLAANYIVRRKS